MSLVVDLCGTLITENTTHAFLRGLSLRGTARFCSALGLSPAISWWDGVTGRSSGRGLQVFGLKGLSRTLLYEEGSKYVRSRLQTHANSKVLEAVREAQRRSVFVYLATATLDPIADAVVKELSLTDMVCSRLDYDRDGICSGRLAVDLLGQKWHALSHLIPSHDRELVVYTDNPDDTDLMEQASHVYYIGNKEAVRTLPLAKFTFI